MGVESEHKEKIIGVLSVLFPEAKIYLFGSRARGKHSKWSDIDIAIDTGKKAAPVAIDEAKSMLGESNIPYKVEVLDFHSVNEEMRNSITQEGILWR